MIKYYYAIIGFLVMFFIMFTIVWFKHKQGQENNPK